MLRSILYPIFFLALIFSFTSIDVEAKPKSAEKKKEASGTKDAPGKKKFVTPESIKWLYKKKKYAKAAELSEKYLFYKNMRILLRPFKPWLLAAWHCVAHPQMASY